MPLKDIEVARDQLALREDSRLEAGINENLQALARELIPLLDWLVCVADRAEEDVTRLLALDFSREDFRGVDLDVQKLAPGLIVAGEAFHEPGVAVDAPVDAPGIAVHAVIRDARLAED